VLDNWQSKSLLQWRVLSFLSLGILNVNLRDRYDHILCTESYIFCSISLLIIKLKWQYNEIVIKYQKFLIDLLTNVWLIARLCNGLNLWCQVDVFTVYFLVWQFTYVFSKWISHELPWFSFNLQRGLLCLWKSFSAIILHDTCLRYSSIHLKLALLWYLAVQDW
jgi:hypothetical protein